jgi:hypothetical protein
MFEYIAQTVQPKSELQALGGILFQVGVIVVVGVVAVILVRHWYLGKKKAKA